MSPYALLGLSVLFEVFGDTCMKLSDGFRRKLPIIGIAVGYAVSFYALSHVFADAGTVVHVAAEGAYLGCILLADAPKANSKAAIEAVDTSAATETCSTTAASP